MKKEVFDVVFLLGIWMVVLRFLKYIVVIKWFRIIILYNYVIKSKLYLFSLIYLVDFLEVVYEEIGYRLFKEMDCRLVVFS